MRLLLTSAGSYPRVGETPALQQLRRTYTAMERQQASPEDLRAAEEALTRAALSEQVEAGLDLVTDGQVRWYDPISHLAGKLNGVRITGLLRFFDTNFYFRQPVAQGEIGRRNGLVLSEYQFARANSTKPVKPVLTGPYTLARHTLAEHAPYQQLEPLVRAYGHALAPELEALAQAGAEVIQLDEPAILKRPADFPLLERALMMLSKHKGKARLALYLYFGDPQPLYERLQRLPVDILGLDFTYNPKLVERVVAVGAEKPLALGLADGRNTRLEDPQALAHQVDRLLLRIKGGLCHLNPSCGLEYLPRDRAFAKLKLLSQVRAHLKGAQ
jgi:5-methyltetrahydropteroyltriglutamate--homocysteine methyltransferase